MLFNLLSDTSATSADPAGGSYTWIFLIGIIAIFVLFFAWNGRSAKKRQKEAQEMLDAIKPGNKVKTIGGICGVVVSVNKEENTFVLETGTEETGKSYIVFDKQAVYQTDAKKDSAVESAPVEQVAEETEQAGTPVVEPELPETDPFASFDNPETSAEENTEAND